MLLGKLRLYRENNTHSMVGSVLLDSILLKLRHAKDVPKELALPVLVVRDSSTGREEVRRTVSLAETALVSDCALRYLNRLSDLVWTLARWREGVSLATRSVPDGSTPDRV